MNEPAHARATYQDVLDAPEHRVADEEPVRLRPFDAIVFSLGDLWP